MAPMRDILGFLGLLQGPTRPKGLNVRQSFCPPSPQQDHWRRHSIIRQTTIISCKHRLSSPFLHTLTPSISLIYIQSHPSGIMNTQRRGSRPVHRSYRRLAYSLTTHHVRQAPFLSCVSACSQEPEQTRSHGQPPHWGTLPERRHGADKNRAVSGHAL